MKSQAFYEQNSHLKQEILINQITYFRELFKSGFITKSLRWKLVAKVKIGDGKEKA